MFCYNITFVMVRHIPITNKNQFWLSILLVVSTFLTVVAHGTHADVLDSHLESIDCKLCQHNIDIDTPKLQVAFAQRYIFEGVQQTKLSNARATSSVKLPPLRAPPHFQ